MSKKKEANDGKGGRLAFLKEKRDDLKARLAAVEKEIKSLAK